MAVILNESPLCTGQLALQNLNYKCIDCSIFLAKKLLSSSSGILSMTEDLHNSRDSTALSASMGRIDELSKAMDFRMFDY